METPNPMNSSVPPLNGSSASIDQNRLLAILGYIIPILFFVPLLTNAKQDAFARFHANQHLNLLLFWVAGNIIVMLLATIIIGALLFPIVVIIGTILMIIGIINAAKGSMKPLPLIGGIELIK